MHWISVHHAVSWSSIDYRDVIVSESGGHTVLLSCRLTLAPAVSFPMISPENAIRCTSLGTRSTRSWQSQLGIKTADPVCLITRRDEDTWERGRRFIPWVNRVLGWNLVYDINKKKREMEKFFKKNKTKDPSVLLFFCFSLSFLLLVVIVLQVFWGRTSATTR